MTGNTKSTPKSSKGQTLVHCPSLQACPKYRKEKATQLPEHGNDALDFTIRRYGCSYHSVAQIGSCALSPPADNCSKKRSRCTLLFVANYSVFSVKLRRSLQGYGVVRRMIITTTMIKTTIISRICGIFEETDQIEGGGPSGIRPRMSCFWK